MGLAVMLNSTPWFSNEPMLLVSMLLKLVPARNLYGVNQVVCLAEIDFGTTGYPPIEESKVYTNVGRGCSSHFSWLL